MLEEDTLVHEEEEEQVRRARAARPKAREEEEWWVHPIVASLAFVDFAVAGTLEESARLGEELPQAETRPIAVAVFLFPFVPFALECPS